MKVPGFFADKLQTEGDVYLIRLSKKNIRIVAIVFIVLFIVSLGLGIWGIARQAEIVRLRDKTQIQTEQLKLLEQKTQILDKKMETLDALDQEIRQMVKGSEGGKVPQGGGDAASDPAAAKKADSGDPSPESDKATSVISLSAKISKIDRDAQRRLASFYMLRGILKDGASDQIQALQSTVFAAGTPGANMTTPSIWPAKGVITSPFGVRVDPVFGGSAYHEGVDIANDYGTPIQATAAGVVTFAGYSGGYGNLIEIDHGNGFVTRYGHNSVLLVTVGTKVNQGESIALMGSTGKSTGSHVHYEVRINGSPIDPMLFLPVQ